jgi:hypothetical protein
MTLAERIKTMPLEERYKFFRAMIEVSEAGRKVGASPQEWARMYADTYNEIDQRLKETSSD